MSSSLTPSLPEGWDPYEELGIQRSATVEEVGPSRSQCPRDPRKCASPRMRRPCHPHTPQSGPVPVGPNIIGMICQVRPPLARFGMISLTLTHHRSFSPLLFPLSHQRPPSLGGQVKASFRRLARLHHPDKAGAQGKGASEKGGERDFILVRLAYEMLCDAERRRAIDAGGYALPNLTYGAVAEVDLDDMRWDEEKQVFLHGCRCSGSYEISSEQLEGGYNTICCSSCSRESRNTHFSQST